MGQEAVRLCDYHQDDVQAVKAAVTPLVDGVDTGNPQGKFLMICLQYDSIYRSLPDPVWWLSGSPAFWPAPSGAGGQWRCCRRGCEWGDCFSSFRCHLQ